MQSSHLGFLAMLGSHLKSSQRKNHLHLIVSVHAHISSAVICLIMLFATAIPCKSGITPGTGIIAASRPNKHRFLANDHSFSLNGRSKNFHYGEFTQLPSTPVLLLHSLSAFHTDEQIQLLPLHIVLIFGSKASAIFS